jgi:hypothetical protein
MWSDTSGIAVQDPSAIMGGPATLAMRRDLLPRLASAGLTLFWTVLIGNELNSTATSHDPAASTAGQCQRLRHPNDSTIELIGATASRCALQPENRAPSRMDTT